MATTHKTVKAGSGGDYTTISAAIAGSSSGTASDYSTITILDGSTYTNNLTVPGTLSYLRIQSTAGFTPTIYGSIGFVTQAGAEYIEIVGANAASKIILSCSGVSQTLLTFAGAGRVAFCTMNYNSTILVPPPTAAFVVEDCNTLGAYNYFVNATPVNNLTLRRCDFSAATCTIFIRCNLLGLVMDRCRVGGTVQLIHGYGGGGIAPVGTWLLTNNVIVSTGNDDFGFIPSWITGNLECYGNTFIQSAAPGTSTCIYGGNPSVNLILKDNEFVGWFRAIRLDSGPHTISHNGFYGNTADTYGAGVVNTDPVTADPLLALDYSISYDSPLVNAGTTVPLTEDILGTHRPQGSAFDIGAYEVLFPGVSAAYMDTEQSIHVDFAGDVVTDSIHNPHSATYLANWTIARADGIEPPRVLNVDRVSNAAVTLWLAGVPATRKQYFTLSLSDSVYIYGTTVLSGASVRTVEGSAPAVLRDTVQVNNGFVDLTGADLGTSGLATTNRSDYEMSTEYETLKKMVYRVLMTTTGQFVLAPSFGGGADLKGLGTPEVVRGIVTNAKASLLRLPGVVDCSVKATLQTNGVITLTANVRTKLLQTVLVSYSSSEGA